jgi:formate/nitrite transporter
MSNEIRIDAFLPTEMAEKAESAGMKKVGLDFWSMFSLAILAGAFIGMGGEFCTLVSTDNGLSFGLSKLLGGLVFCLGLILVVIAGSELFTGNNLIVMAWVSGKVTLGQLMRNWLTVYFGNLTGSLITVMIMFFTRQWTFSSYHVGATALNIANTKCNLAFGEALARGIMCNALVCLAVWMCMSSRSVVDKIFAIIFPITAFVASGFEHSVANMYFIPLGILLKSEPDVVAAAGKTLSDLSNLSWQGFIIKNLLPVTIGNIFGGGFMVAAVYWFVYRRPLVGKHYGIRQIIDLFVGSPESQSGRDAAKQD